MKLLTALFLTFALACSTLDVSAQASKSRKNAPYSMRDGVTMRSGKMIEIKNGKERPLVNTFTAPNGTKVKPNGIVMYPGGRQEKLAEGYAVNMEGEKVIFADDMIAPDAIRSHQKKVTGKEATTFTVTEKTKIVINDSTGRKAVHDTIRTGTMR